MRRSEGTRWFKLAPIVGILAAFAGCVTYYDPDGKPTSKGVDQGFWKWATDTVKQFTELSEEQHSQYLKEGMPLEKVSVDDKIFLGIGTIDKSDELAKL